MSLETRARDIVSTYGEEVTLRNRSKTGEDDYSENYDESSSTVDGRVVRGSGVEELRDSYGYDVDSAAEIYVSDQISGIQDGGGKLASRIDTNSETYIVMVLDKQGNGLFRLICQRAD